MKEKTKGVLKILIICILAYAVFASIVALLFHSIRYNKVDGEAVGYIRYESNITEEYGEIVYVARNISRKTIKSDDTMKKTYSIEFSDKEFIVYVEFISTEDGWDAVDYEIVEIRDADRNIIYKE